MNQKYSTHVVSGEIDEEDEPVQNPPPKQETPKAEESNHISSISNQKKQKRPWRT